MNNENEKFDLDNRNLNTDEWGYYNSTHDPRAMGSTAIFSPENIPTTPEASINSPEPLPLPSNNPVPPLGQSNIEIINIDSPSSQTTATTPKNSNTLAHLQDMIKAHHGEINNHTATAIETAISATSDPSEIVAIRNAIDEGEG